MFNRRKLSSLGWVFLAFLAMWMILWPAQKAFAESSPPLAANEFAALMRAGKNHYDQGQDDKAVEVFQKSVSLQPTHPEARLNLAGTYLRAHQAGKALQEAKEALGLDPSSARARFIAGCASIRLAKHEDAIKYLQECRDIDIKINAVSFQLARAHQEAGHYPEAVELLQSVLQWEPDHQAAHYAISRALLRLGRNDEAKNEAEQHAKILAQKPVPNQDPSFFERCVYTEMQVPFVLEQPTVPGIRVFFVDETQTAFGTNASRFHPPLGVIDIDQRGQNDLLAREEDGFRLLLNTRGSFAAHGPKIPGLPGARCSRCLIGDLNNDRFEDAVLFSEQGIQILKFATNGATTDATAFAGMKRAAGVNGALVDMDLTGKLDLIVVSPTNREPRFLRNLGPVYFKDITATSGIPPQITKTKQLLVEDWNGDDLMDLFVLSEGQSPQLMIKQRGGPLTLYTPTNPWPVGITMTAGDLNNDFRTDLIVAASNAITIVFGGLDQRVALPLADGAPDFLKLVDYDNDGWLDLIAAGSILRVWRNLGQSGFIETTRDLKLDTIQKGRILSLNTADFDQDGDIDWVLGIEGRGLQFLRNDGGHINHLLKLRLVGNRSNASGLGVRIEVRASAWQTLRTVAELPVEIGVGKFEKPDLVRSRWSDLSIPVSFEFKADPKVVWNVIELELPTGSCPYLYAWDGQRFRFVTDILGAAPMGLHISDTRLADADPEELVWIGDEKQFVPRKGLFMLQITSELREVLFLDEAKLVVVDHAAGTEVHSTSKMLPSRPFVPHDIWTVHRPRPLRSAVRSDGLDVTELVSSIDGRKVSPIRLRIPQLRGLAEPYDITLDFGPLETERPLVLALTGWLRFGGGMANVAGSHDPNLPFPFPGLEVETATDSWKPVDIVAGVPCGKTKTILVDLTGVLPPGSHRLRLRTAYELYWDRIALFERADQSNTRVTKLAPEGTDLHWRGYSEFEDLPSDVPLTPNYSNSSSNAKWRIMPEGWCTRYGAVDELIAQSDDALVILNSGDELTLAFAANELPAPPPGTIREFFLYSVGWEKDSDFHVEKGWTVEPLPFHGMDDQLYGQQTRPVINGDTWMEKYNTRWAGPETLRRAR